MSESPFEMPEIKRSKRLYAASPTTEQQQQLIEFLTPSQLAAYIPPENARIVGDFHITRGATFVFAGAPGVGKSRALNSLAVAGAYGGEWLGLRVHRRFKTMIIQNENGRCRLQSEFADLDCSRLDQWVRICPPPPFGMCMDRTAFREQLKDAILAFQPDVVGFDPWNAVARDEKARDYLETFNLIRSIIPAGDDAPALGIVAHTRKPRADERANGRGLLNLLAGSYVLGSVPRSVFVMQAATDDPEDSRIVWTCCKNNDGPMGQRTAWVRRNGGFLAVDDFDWDSFDSGTKSEAPRKNEAVEIVAASTKRMSKSEIAAQLKKTGMAQATAYRRIDTGIASGELKFDPESGEYSATSQKVSQ